MTSPFSDVRPNAFVRVLDSSETTRALRRSLANETDEESVVWVDADSTVLVQAAKAQVVLRPGLALVELPMSTDQTGTVSLVIPLRVGSSGADATLLAVTEGLPRGNPKLAARWGTVAQDAVWQGLLRMGQ